MHFYQCSPIDWNWKSLLTVEEYVQRMATNNCPYDLKDEEKYVNFSGIVMDSINFAQRLEIILEIAKQEFGWEGDFTQTPRVFFMPDPEDFHWQVGFAWKQSNNGSTFIVSPQQLHYLEHDFIEHKEIKEFSKYKISAQ